MATFRVIIYSNNFVQEFYIILKNQKFSSSKFQECRFPRLKLLRNRKQLNNLEYAQNLTVLGHVYFFELADILSRFYVYCNFFGKK